MELERRRLMRFEETALTLMKREPVDPAQPSEEELVLFRVQGEVIKLCETFARTKVEATCKKLVNKTKTVAAWVKADAAEIVCFAIGVSDDRGRTWTYPMLN